MDRKEIESKVTDSIIAALEQGVAPWRKPWTAGAFDMPTSVATGKAYRGINWLILESKRMEKGYARNLWLTFKQAKAMGGKVRKGEKSTAIVFWRIVKAEKDIDGKREEVKVPLLRYYNVFNVEQVDGLELPPRFTKVDDREPVEVLDGLQTLIDGYVDAPEVHHVGGDRAYYTPSLDTITMPKREQFDSAEGYAETLLHEFVHSTGHESRLNRLDGGACFGSESYAQEELVAEIGMAMLAQIAGINVTTEQTASYVQSWLKVLKDDRSLVIKAAQQAQKAVERIAPSTPIAEESEESEEALVAA